MGPHVPCRGTLAWGALLGMRVSAQEYHALLPLLPNRQLSPGEGPGNVERVGPAEVIWTSQAWCGSVMDKWFGFYLPTGLGPGGGDGRILLPLCAAW